MAKFLVNKNRRVTGCKGSGQPGRIRQANLGPSVIPVSPLPTLQHVNSYRFSQCPLPSRSLNSLPSWSPPSVGAPAGDESGWAPGPPRVGVCVSFLLKLTRYFQVLRVSRSCFLIPDSDTEIQDRQIRSVHLRPNKDKEVESRSRQGHWDSGVCVSLSL